MFGVFKMDVQLFVKYSFSLLCFIQLYIYAGYCESLGLEYENATRNYDLPFPSITTEFNTSSRGSYFEDFLLNFPMFSTSVPDLLAISLSMDDLLSYDPWNYSSAEFTNSLLKFGNELQRNIVNIQLRFCPYMPLCTLTVVPVEPLELFYESCCLQCSCDISTCQENQTCCPDILDQSFFKSDPKLSDKMTHRQAQPTDGAGTIYSTHADSGLATNLPKSELNRRRCISRWLKSEGDYISALADCPSSSSEVYTENCSLEYNADVHSLIDVLPCVSKSTLEVFRNRYCAYCNGYSDNDLELFEPVLRCTSTPNLKELQNANEIFKRVMKQEGCDIYFSKEDYELENCMSSIDKCNKTGRWSSYSNSIELACGLYTTFFVYEYERYSNIFCAVCNGLDLDRFRYQCPKVKGHETRSHYTFTGLLKLEVPSTQDDSAARCPAGDIYDNVKVSCFFLN